MELEDLLERFPLCQLRGSPTANYTFWYGHRGEDGLWRAGHILKGPYREDVMTQIKERFTALRSAGCEALSYPVAFEDSYIFYDNLDPHCAVPVISQQHGDRIFRVIEQRGIRKLDDIIEKIPPPGNLAEVLFTLCHMRRVGVSGVGLTNLLYQEKTGCCTIVGLDSTGKQHRGKLFYFTDQLDKAKAARWLQWVTPLHREVAQRLKATGCHEEAALLLAKVADPERGLWNGLMASKTRGGHGLDVVKSAIQKNIRRGDFRQAASWLDEMWRLGEIPGAAAVRGNLYNRLGIIVMEDIGVANPALVLGTLKMVMARPPELGLVLAYVEAMCNSPKIRLCSHVARGVYDVVPDCAPRDLPDPGVVQWQPRDPPEVQRLGNIFFAQLLWCRDHATGLNQLTFLRHLRYYRIHCEENKVKTAPRARRTHWASPLWEGLIRLCPAVATLRDFYHHHQFQERPYFLLLGGLFALFRVEATPLDLTAIAVPPAVELRHDAVIYDIHTRIGKARGATRQQFVTEGSQVIPEDPRYVYPELQAFYRTGR